MSCIRFVLIKYNTRFDIKAGYNIVNTQFIDYPKVFRGWTSQLNMESSKHYEWILHNLEVQDF